MARSKRKRSSNYVPRDRRVAFNDRRDSIDDPLTSWGASKVDATGGAPSSLVHRLRLAAAKAAQPLAGVWGGPAPYRFIPVNTLRSALASVRLPVFRPAPASPPRFVAGMNVLPALQPRDRVCVRRLQRKQVLFAAGVAGRRRSAPGPYHRTMDSQRSC